MPQVTYDERSFQIDGRRIWLVSGEIHYFRTPSGLWQDRLLKAKRCGLNCVCTYVAWNFHEPVEGQWQHGSDYDIAKFIRTAQELGLYVILRPGPYICAEWDMGGLPGWLAAKSGMAYRTSNAAFMHYFDKYFRQILPPLAELQVTHGGPIVAIQNENEYLMSTMPERASYLNFISQLFRRSGFEIPIINCNLFSDPQVEGTIECVNGWNRLRADLRRMRARQPDKPLLVTELWDGWFDYWGGEHTRRDARKVVQRTTEVLGCGSQYNYYMFHGGTNTAFWGSRLNASAAAYQTTSYDYDAPIAEGGALTGKYYAMRPLNILASTMGERFFATCSPDGPRSTLTGTPDVMTLTGPVACWAVVSSGSQDDMKTAAITLPDGRRLEVPLEPFGAAAVPFDLEIDSEVVLDYANCTPLGLLGNRVLALHGPAGWRVKLSVNGKILSGEIPEGDEPVRIEHEHLVILLLNTELAMRTWQVENEVFFGPDFVGATPEEVTPHRSAKEFWVLTAEGELKKRRVGKAPARAAAAPRLRAFRAVGVSPEPIAKDLEWQKIDGPRDVDQLGVHYGYVWYRIQVEQKRPATRQLYLPDAADRATLFLNGQRLGVFGSGPGADETPIKAALKAGMNELVVLLDNLGRENFGPRLGMRKGVFRHIHDVSNLRLSPFTLKFLAEWPRRIIPRSLDHMKERLEDMPAFEAATDFVLTSVGRVHVSFSDVPHHMAIFCNDRLASFAPSPGPTNFGSITLQAGLKKGRNHLKLVLWGNADAKALGNWQVLSLNSQLDSGQWFFRRWAPPAQRHRDVKGHRLVPAWFAGGFKYVASTVPLFLSLDGAHKGQIFLNGRNLGRFWTVGPQAWYYLPEPWLAEENELLIFSEDGSAPSGAKLAHLSVSPFES